MPKKLVLACSLLLVGQWAGADILKTRRGEEFKGTVQLVTFVVDDIQTIYPRDEVVSVQLSADGKDALEARSEGKQEGKLVSVMFEAPGGLRAVTRDKIAAITFDKATTMEVQRAQEQEESEKKEEDKSELSAEQEEALTTNRELGKAYLEAAESLKDEGYEAVKAKYMSKVREVVNDVQRLERSIYNKIRRRQQASGRSYLDSRGHRRMSERERLERYDGLARDQQDLERAKDAARKLKATIRADEKKVREKDEQRVARIRAVYAENRKKALDGQPPTEDAMTDRYEAAICLPGEKAPKVSRPRRGAASGGTGGKVQQGLSDLKGN